MRFTKLLFCLCMCALLSRTRSTASTTESNIVTLPVKLNHGRIILSATIKESAPLSFLLDTACTINTLHPALVDELKLEPSGSVNITGIAGIEKAPTYRGVVFDLNGERYSSRQVAAIPSERGQSRRRDGVLGYSFLRRYVVEIDAKAKTTKLFSPTNFVYKGKGEVIPFRFKDEIPVVKASMIWPGREPLEAEYELDTGCDSGLCIGAHYVEEHGLLKKHGATEASEKFGVGGKVDTQSGAVPIFQIGKSQVRKPQTDFFASGSPVDAPLAGHIGMGVLNDFVVILDYSRKQMILEPRAQ